MSRNEKLFVGGYYDERICRGEQFEGKTPFNKEINVYSLDEVLELGFVQNVTEWFEEFEGKSWDEATEQEQINAIIEYTSTDEIAGLVHFNTETEALKYKEDIIKEIEEIENNSEYQGKEQDSEGNFREVYTVKEIS